MLLMLCLKVAEMFVTFHVYPLKKYFVDNFDFLGRYSNFGPLQMSTPGGVRRLVENSTNFLIFFNPSL